MVSGTTFATNTIVNPPAIANMKKVPEREKKLCYYIDNIIKTPREREREMYQVIPSELQSIRKLKAYEIIQVPNQLTAVTRLPPNIFMFIGNI